MNILILLLNRQIHIWRYIVKIITTKKSKKEMEVGLVDIIRQGSYNCTELILLINYEMF